MKNALRIIAALLAVALVGPAFGASRKALPKAAGPSIGAPAKAHKARAPMSDAKKAAFAARMAKARAARTAKAGQ